MLKYAIRSVFALALAITLALGLAVPTVVRAEEEIPEEVKNSYTVWDFENVPQNLDGWYSDLYVECGWNETGKIGMSAGNWTLSVEEGKGYNGSKGLQAFLPKHQWGNTTYVSLKKDKTAFTDWTGAKELFFWVDASELTELTQGVRLDLILLEASEQISYETTMNPGSPYQYWQDGSWQSAEVNSWGHIIIPVGFCGWMRVPLGETIRLPSDMSRVNRIAFYTEHEAINGSVYFDNFAIDVPPSVKVEYQDPTDFKGGTIVWDMERLPNDFTGWTTDRFFELWGDETVGVMGGNWKPVKNRGTGFGGTTALGWEMLTTNWGSTTFVDLTMDPTAKTNWIGAEELYFFVDATEITNSMPIDVILPLSDPAAEFMQTPGATYLIWKNNQWVEQTINEYGHYVIPAEYYGWIRVPLAQVYGENVNLSNVNRIGFYTEHAQIGSTVYFDHFVVTPKLDNSKPADPTEPSVEATEPSVGETEPSQVPTVPQETQPQGGTQNPQGNNDLILIVVVAVVCVGVIVVALIIRKKREE